MLLIAVVRSGEKRKKNLSWMGYNVPFITLILLLVVFFLVPCTGRATKKTQIFFRTLFPSFIFFYNIPCLMVDEKDGPTSCEENQKEIAHVRKAFLSLLLALFSV
jgi:hypothetical protein